MTEAATQVETKPTAPDTTVIVTGDTMQAFTESRTSGGEFKPEETPKPAPQAQTEENDHAEAEPKPGEPKKPLSKWQIENNERFSKVTAERKAAEERAAAAERERDELRAKITPAPKVDEPDARPDPEKYKDASGNFDAFKYAEDLAGWKVNDTLRARAAAEVQEKQQREAQSILDRFNKNRDEFKATVPDWDARAAVNPQMHGEVISAIVESDFGPQMFYELSGDLALVKKINEMPNMRDRLRAIGRLEAKYEKASGTEAKETRTAPASDEQLSRAPDPISPIKTTHSAPASRVDKDGNYIGSQEEYERDRKAGKLH